jgi:hypothetical protein
MAVFMSGTMASVPVSVKNVAPRPRSERCNAMISPGINELETASERGCGHITARILVKLPFAMSHSVRFAFPALTLALITLHTPGVSAADNARRFMVPANDGYGLADCLNEGNACGAVVADALCETRGFKKSASYGAVDPADITASIEKPAPAGQRTFVITCAD